MSVEKILQQVDELQELTELKADGQRFISECPYD